MYNVFCWSVISLWLPRSFVQFYLLYAVLLICDDMYKVIHVFLYLHVNHRVEACLGLVKHGKEVLTYRGEWSRML